MTSEIDKLKHFHVENYSGIYFTDELSSAPWEINLVQKLCDWNIISPLRFTDDEWCQISSDGTCQNRREGNVFKEPYLLIIGL
nr:MAG: hypothetical protein [Bacteriophage sp.]